MIFMKKRATILFAVTCFAVGGLIGEWAYAITPPPPVAPTLASVILTITPATVRADKVTPFALSEIKEHRLYFTQLSAYIAVPAPTLVYTWIIPSGQCFKAADSVAATTVDTGGLESDGSVSVSLAADRCSGKSLPGKPGVLISAGT
jgi:hypothetical protein